MTITVGGFTSAVASIGDETLIADGGRRLYLGLDGRDLLRNDRVEGEAYLVGGAGSDAYLAVPDGFTVIHETGNDPDDLFSDIAIEADPQTLAATIDGRHLLLNSLDPDGVILFVDWEVPENRIEFWNLAIPGPDGPTFETTTFEAFRDAVLASPDYLGDVAFSDLAISDQLRAELQEAIDFVATGALPPSETPDAVRTVALLYEAALGRQAEFDGLNFWIDARAGGLAEDALALEFLESPEFGGTVGDPFGLSDRDLVEALYLNVLDRPGETEGVDFWTGTLAVPGFDREDLLIAFATAPENAAASPEVQGLFQLSEGVWDFAPLA